MTSRDKRSSGLSTHDLNVLDDACHVFVTAFGTHPYLVGSAGEFAAYRDVDVRLILDDKEFDTLCPTRDRWELLSLALGDYLRKRTGLPVDFQIQRQTEANERHRKPRNPLGTSRTFAAGGDATPWTPIPQPAPDVTEPILPVPQGDWDRWDLGWGPLLRQNNLTTNGPIDIEWRVV